MSHLLLPVLLGAAVFRRQSRLHRQALAALQARLDELQRDAASRAELSERAMTTTLSQLRHDLRGILSPAMLTADRLTMSDDPLARRAGETMVTAVERAVERLANTKQQE